MAVLTRAELQKANLCEPDFAMRDRTKPTSAMHGWAARSWSGPRRRADCVALFALKAWTAPTCTTPICTTPKGLRRLS
jgi:hypothetical protein